MAPGATTVSFQQQPKSMNCGKIVAISLPCGIFGMDAAGADELRQRYAEDPRERDGGGLASAPALSRVDAASASALELKYLNELRRSPTRSELRLEAVGQLKAVLVSAGWHRAALSGMDREALIDAVLPLLDADNAHYDDEPLPLGSNCWQQLVLRGLLLAVALSYVHALLGLTGAASAAAYAAEAAALAARNVRCRRAKADRLRKAS